MVDEVKINVSELAWPATARTKKSKDNQIHRCGSRPPSVRARAMSPNEPDVPIS